MKKMLFRGGLSAALLGTVLYSSVLHGFERDHDAHEHGHAVLLLATEGDEVQMEFTSPAINIVGFEHQPDSEEDKHKVEQAKSSLMQTEELFVFNPEAACKVEHVEVESALLSDDAHHEHHDEHKDHHDDHHSEAKHHDDHHDEEKHHDHHDEEKHHDEHDDHHHEHEEGEAHSEFSVEYHFECDNIEKLKSLNVLLFEKFTSLEEVEVNLVSSDGQQRMELDKDTTEITF